MIATWGSKVKLTLEDKPVSWEDRAAQWETDIHDEVTEPMHAPGWDFVLREIFLLLAPGTVVSLVITAGSV